MSPQVVLNLENLRNFDRINSISNQVINRGLTQNMNIRNQSANISINSKLMIYG